MKSTRKIVSLVLAAVLMLSVFIITPISTSAVTSCTQSEAVAWATAQIGYKIGTGQCVAFIKSYYEYLGVTPVRGDARDYRSNALPSGWQRINNYAGFSPNPGDICVWGPYQGPANSEYGHVGIVTSGNSSLFNTVEQNVRGLYVQTCTGRATNAVSCFIRPDFTSPTLSFHARTDRGEEGQYYCGENVSISLDNWNFDSCSLEIVYTPTNGSTVQYWSGNVSKEPVVMQFNEVGHYSCVYSINSNGQIFYSTWVGWDINPVFHAKTDRGEEGQYYSGEKVSISLDNLDFETCSLEIVYTPTNGSTVQYWNGEATKEPVVMQFNEVGHYSCVYSVNRYGKTYYSTWVGWDINPVYYAKTDKGEEGQYNSDEYVRISLDNLDFDDCSLHIFYTPFNGTTSEFWNENVTKEPVSMKFDKEGHYSCYYHIVRNGKEYDSKWVGWDIKNNNTTEPIPTETQPVTDNPTEPTETEPVTDKPTEPTETQPVTDKPTEPTETQPVETQSSKTDISKWNVSGIKNKTYTGKVIKQDNIIVSDNDEYADFSVKYKGNLNVGTATVTITGTGDYTGTITKTFKITKAENTVKVTAKKIVKAKAKKKTAIKKAITVKNPQGKVTYKTNNKKVTVKSGKLIVAKGFKTSKTIKVKVTITAKGNSNYKMKKIVKTIRIRVK